MSSQGEILDEVTRFVAKKSRQASVSPSSAFSSDLSFDELDFVDLIWNCEEKFAIEIPDEAAEKIETVSELAEFIHYRLNPRCPNPVFLQKNRRSTPELAGIHGCMNQSVKTIGWSAPLFLGIGLLAGAPLTYQLAAPITAAIIGLATVTLAVAGVEAWRGYTSTKGHPMTTEVSGRLVSQRRDGWISGGLVLLILIVSLFVPCPTVTQQRVFQILISLGSAGIVANLPGFLHVEISNRVRAGGALAAFVVVLLLNPATWALSDSTSSNASCEGSIPSSLRR